MAAITKKPLTLLQVAILAFVAMCVQDILGTAMVIEEARLNAPVAGLLDVAGWITGLICAALAIESIINEGWRTRRSLIIIGAVSTANFLGTLAGVSLASHLIHH